MVAAKLGRCVVPVLVAVVVLFGAAPAMAAPIFTTPADVVGSSPQSVAVGEFNGDGRQDLVIANTASGTVSVLLGNGTGGIGDGTFTAAASPATGSGPQSVAVGDFNGDGRQDLATANAGASTVSVLLGNGTGSIGDGTFTAAASPATGSSPQSVVVGDFNGDGRQDLATANTAASTVSVLLGDGTGSIGDGTFTAAAPAATGSSPRSVAVGDFNGDGRQDLATANANVNSVSVLLGDGTGSIGDGTFTAAASPATGGSPVSVAVGDFNGDGRQDLATANAGASTVSVLLGDGTGSIGDGTFTAAAPAATGSSPRSVAVGDVNGDGRQDLATANVGVRTVSVLLGNGAGSTGDGTFTAAASLTTGGPVSVAVGDFNGDGRQDLAATNFNANSVSVFLGNGTGSTGDGTFTATTSPATGTNPQSVVVGDFNGDGRQDLATANINANSVSVLLGDGTGGIGDGTFTAAASPATGGGPYSVAVGDFNGDGRQDLATPNANVDSVSVLLGNGAGSTGDGTFTAAASPATDSNPRAAAVGDFNGDGRQDLAIASTGADSVSVLLGNGAGSTGDGTFTKAASPATGDGPFSVAVGDFNGDGRQDLATANNSANKVSVLLGNGTGSTGDGTFTAAASPATGTNPRSVAVGDFNGDGRQDLATANAGSSTVSVLLGNGTGSTGDGTFTPAASPATGGSPRSLAVGDFNGDGRQDLATANFNANSVSVLLGNGTGSTGDGTFTADFAPSTGRAPISVAVGDFSGDARPDLAVAAVNASQVFVLPNESAAAVAAPGSVLISEVRLAGVNGARDQFVDLYNSTADTVDVGGWEVVGSQGTRTRLAAGTLIAPKHHFLLNGPVNSALASFFSLAGVASMDGFLAPGPVEPAGGGVKLVNLAGSMIDAVGFSSAPSGFFRGTPLSTPTNTAAGQLALTRRHVAGVPVNTANNASDFRLVATDADTQAHNGSEVLGAPAPFNLRSPTNVNNGVQSALIDAAASASAAPNRVYMPPTSGTVSAANPGTLVLRRTITNCFGQPTSGPCANAQPATAPLTITRLWVHITAITTYGDSAGATGSPALLRTLDAPAGSVGTSTGTKTLSAVSLNAPSPASGGGLNSTLVIALPGGALAPGAAVNIELRLRVDKTGSYALAYNAIDDLQASTLGRSARAQAPNPPPATRQPPAPLDRTTSDRTPSPAAGGGERAAGQITATGATLTTTLNPMAARCVVPKLTGKTITAAARALNAAHCKLGKVTTAIVDSAGLREVWVRAEPQLLTALLLQHAVLSVGDG